MVAEKVLKASKLLKKLFVEQDIGDLGVVPSEPLDLVTVGEVENVVVGEELQDIVTEMEKKGLEVEVLEDDKGVGFIVNTADGKQLTFVFDNLDGEPVLQIWTGDGKITVSLAPLIGSVDSVPTVVERIAGDEEAVEELVDFVVDVVGEEYEFEELIEEPSVDLGDEEEKGDEEEVGGDIERGEDELGSEEEEEEEREVGESRRKFRGRRMREQIETEKVSDKILKKLTFPAFSKKFQPREGQPDIISYVTQKEEG